MKISTTVLFLGLVHFASAREPTAPPPPTGRLALGQPPKFSTLTDASFRFLNPQQYDQSWGGLKADPASIILTLGGKETPALKADDVGVQFRQQDLTPPGSHYPPALPVGPETPVQKLGFSVEIPQGELKPIATSLFPMLQLDGEKVMVWADNELWKLGSSLLMNGTLPGGGTAEARLSHETEETFTLLLTFNWLQENQEGARVSRPRALPQVPPSPGTIPAPPPAIPQQQQQREPRR